MCDAPPSRPSHCRRDATDVALHPNSFLFPHYLEDRSPPILIIIQREKGYFSREAIFSKRSSSRFDYFRGKILALRIIYYPTEAKQRSRPRLLSLLCQGVALR